MHRNWLAITHTFPISKWYYDVRVLKRGYVCNISDDGCCRRHLSGVNTYSILSVPLAKFTLIALDYPPFFAYFEKLLSIPAFFIDSKIVDVNNLNYDAWSVIAYQRATVIVTELVLGIVLLRSVLPYCHLIVSWRTPPPHSFVQGSVEPSLQRIVSASIFLHPGFLIVDHIHFQYNGFMYGILLWSILMARNVSFTVSWFIGGWWQVYIG